MKIERKFTHSAVDYQQMFVHNSSDVTITDINGEVKFAQKNVEHPAEWSNNAVTIAASKYFYGNIGDNTRETSVFSMVERVVNQITEWGIMQEYFDDAQEAENFRQELGFICLNQMAAFNSPVWFNFGTPDNRHRQASACFIQNVSDTMESIMQLTTNEALIFKGGSGSGVNLSPLRSSYEPLSGGGWASGPVSFMKGLDAFAGVIQSGGRTRRAASIRILDIDHPDILQTADGGAGFITCKVEEEKKAQALIAAGYSADYTDPNGAYSSLQFQNANHSVRIPDSFMQAVANDEEYTTNAITTNKTIHTYKAREVLRKIAEAAYFCGEPGVQFSDNINKWHTIPNVAPINASNPCSEFVFIDNSSCNLASINLGKFVDDNGHFDVEGFQHTIRILILAQDIIIDKAYYPTEEIKDNSIKYRPLGLGFTNLHTILMRMGKPYDDVDSNRIAAAITSLMTATAYAQSGTIAQEKSAFETCAQSAIAQVIAHHIHAHEQLAESVTDDRTQYIIDSASKSWYTAKYYASKHLIRNAQVTLLAPTGTISFLMDAQTTGIEPEIALIKWKQLVGGGTMKLVNPEVGNALRALGYKEAQIEGVLNYILEHKTIEGCNIVKPEHLSVFDCAYVGETSTRSIDYNGHLRMMAAVQPFLSGAISKTISFPNDATIDDIYNAIINAHKLGIKAAAFYRDGSRSQPIITQEAKDTSHIHAPIRRELPDTRSRALIHKFTIGGQKHYLMLGMFEDGQLGEIFLTASGGGTYDALLSNWAIAVSIALQYGVPLQDFIRQFRYKEFQPNGFTSNKDIPTALSPIDYVAKFLDNYFMNGNHDKKQDHNKQGPPCPNCGHMMIRKGTCYYCEVCGDSSGCS